MGELPNGQPIAEYAPRQIDINIQEERLQPLINLTRPPLDEGNAPLKPATRIIAGQPRADYEITFGNDGSYPASVPDVIAQIRQTNPLPSANPV